MRDPKAAQAALRLAGALGARGSGPARHAKKLKALAMRTLLASLLLFAHRSAYAHNRATATSRPREGSKLSGSGTSRCGDLDFAIG